MAIVCWWLASRHLLRDMSLNAASSIWLRRGAWLGLACAVLSILTRPFISYLYTLHLPAPSQLWLWNTNPNDLLGLLICGVLLMLSYLMAWMSEIAEENKAFV
jgi:cell division protein FtsX